MCIRDSGAAGLDYHMGVIKKHPEWIKEVWHSDETSRTKHQTETDEPVEQGTKHEIHKVLHEEAIECMCANLNLAHFSRVFKKQVGVSANEYRNQVLGK